MVFLEFSGVAGGNLNGLAHALTARLPCCTVHRGEQGIEFRPDSSIFSAFHYLELTFDILNITQAY